MPAGSSIGYGRTRKLEKPTRVGTISAGYADGIPMQITRGEHVTINGKNCPILGRISMDYTTISLENAPEAQPGDEAICLGNGITVADWANLKQTNTYEIICAFGNRVERVYT